MTTRRVVLAVAVVALLGAATDGVITVDRALRESTPHVTATTAVPQPVITVSDALARLQGITGAGNAVLAGEYQPAVNAYTAAPSDQARAALRAAAEHLAVVEREGITSLNSTDWPGGVRSAADELLVILAQTVHSADATAAADTDKDITAALALFPSPKS